MARWWKGWTAITLWAGGGFVAWVTLSAVGDRWGDVGVLLAAVYFLLGVTLYDSFAQSTKMRVLQRHYNALNRALQYHLATDNKAAANTVKLIDEIRKELLTDEDEEWTTH
jgi:hypothetical protein